MYALEAGSGRPVLKTDAAATGILSQLAMLQADARPWGQTKKKPETRREKAVYVNGQDVLIVLGEPVRAPYEN